MQTLDTNYRLMKMLDLIFKECSDAMRLHPKPMNSAHEAYAVISEELDEFWEHVRRKRADRNNVEMAKELIQTAAVCVRAIHDLNLPVEDFRECHKQT